MGNSRPGGTPRSTDGGGTARENAGAGTGTNASGRLAVMALAARSGTNNTATDAPPLPRRSARNAPAPSQERAGTGTNASGRLVVMGLAARSGTNNTVMDAPPPPRRSARDAPAPSQERASTGLGNVTRPRSKRQQNRAAAEETPLRVSTAIKTSSSGSLSRDSDRSVGSRKRGEEQMSESGRNENASSSSKKRKVANSRSYIKRFKAVQGANAAGAVVASPDRVGKENTSGGHVADSNISKLCEGRRLIEKNKRHSSDAVSKVSRSLAFGLHETSATRVNQCSAPFLEEPLTSDCRNTEHMEIDNIAKPSMLLGGATSLVRGVNANHDDTLDTDGVHLESPDSSSQSLVALVGTQAVLSCMSSQHGTDLSAQQNVAPSRCPPAEAEQTGLSGTQAVQVLQPEMQPSILFLDAPARKTHPDDRNQTGCEPDRATGLSQEGTASCHHFGDVRMQVQEKIDGNVVADPVLPESPTYPADSPVTLHMSTEVESQICEPSMAAKQSTNSPAQQTSAISQNPPAEAEQSGILGTEGAWDLQTEVQPLISMQVQPTEAERAACDLQPEVQPSTSVQDERAEAEDESEVEYEPEVPEVEDEPAEAERAGILGGIPARDLQPEMQSLTSTQVVRFEQTYISGMPVVQGPAIHRCLEPSLDPHAGVESAGMVTAQDLQSEILPSATVPAEQNTSLPAQESLATSQHPPAEATPAGILGTEPACDWQPEVQPSTSVQDEPAEPQHEPEPEDEPEVPEVDDESEAEGEPEIEDEPAEAEKTGTLGAIASQDLQPEMQSSTPQQVVPFERTSLSCMPVLQGPTVHGSVEPSLDPHAGVESAGMVTAHDIQSEILASALLPMEQSTTLSAQQSLPTSRHLPGEAEPADILVTEAACDLQPSQGEVQPSTSVHDQPAEEPACILGAIAAQSLHPVVQPSTSMQSAPFERTFLVGMPVLQSLTLHHSVEPSLDPHARAESRHTLGALTAHDLQSEVQQSVSMQDRPAGAEGAVMLGSTAAQDSQPELQSLTTVQDVPLERIYSEERRQIGFQPNLVPGPEQPIQIPPVATLVFNNPILSDEPLKNELDRLMHSNNMLSKDHEHKKSLLLIEYNQELEKIKKNYDSLLQNEDSIYHQTEREFTDVYRKVFLSRSLAENFRGLLPPSSAGQGRSTSPAMEQPFASSTAAQTAASPVILSPAIRPPRHNSPGSYVRPSFVAQPSSPSSWNAQPASTLPGNLYGSTSSLVVPAPVQHGSCGSAGAQSRAVQPQSALPGNRYRTMPHVRPPHLPHGRYGSAGTQLRASAPHLRQLRMPSPYATHTDQQQLPPANAGHTSLGLFVPVTMGSSASTIPQRGARQNSMDSSSVHQTMLPSASSSLPPRPAYSLPSGRHLESMVNFLQSSSSNPAFFASQQSWYQNIALGSTSGLPTAAPGSQHAGAQIAGANQSGSLSASLDAYLTGRLGLGSSSIPAGAGASPVVVCLSDDESS